MLSDLKPMMKLTVVALVALLVTSVGAQTETSDPPAPSATADACVMNCLNVAAEKINCQTRCVLPGFWFAAFC